MPLLIDFVCPDESCGARVEGFKGDDPPVCEKCGKVMEPFTFKNNPHKWRWNDTGFDRM